MSRAPSTPTAPLASTPSGGWDLDLDELRSVVSDAVIRQGIAYFREDRVTELSWGAEWAEGCVEGSRTDAPYQVRLDFNDGELGVECDCPFEWEPLCKHAVALVLATSARAGLSERAGERAEEAAMAERQRSAREHVSVRHVDGDRWFGTWEAHSGALHGISARRWTVQIRSLGEPINHCGCPDFATNLLGSCKHIEAVLHALQKRAPKKFERLQRGPAPLWVVGLDTASEHEPEPRLRRGPTDPRLSKLLQPWFDGDGRFTGELPDDLFGLRDAAQGEARVLVADEVLRFAELLAAEQRHAARGAELRASIRASGGRLPGLHATLYPYQVEGVAFLAGTGRAVLADDMGLGKTLQAIAASQLLVQQGRAARVLVLCPASLKAQWAREIERFAGLDTQVVQGNVLTRAAQWARGATFTIANYELLLRDHERIQADLAPDVLVLDEAQRIKNWRTKTADHVKRLRTRYAFLLTGTPLENRLEDLYSLMQVVDPRILGPLWRFHADFHVTDGRGKVLGYRNIGELKRRLAPVLLRRDRRLVRDQLPDRITQQLDIPLTKGQREVHDDSLSAARRLAAIAERRPLTPSERNRLMAALQRTRMSCDALGLVDKETIGSPKLDELGRLLDELVVGTRRKVVIFSEWERMTAAAGDVARDLGLGVVSLHGGVPTARRGALLERFESDPDSQVFLSTDAGGVGLNLQCASLLINLDLPWNPAVLNQRIARIHRLGQTEPAHVILLVAADSYEQAVGTLLAGKSELFAAAVGEDDADVVAIGGGTLKAALASLEVEGAPSGDSPAPRDEPTRPETTEPGPTQPDAAQPEAPKPEAPRDEAPAPPGAAEPEVHGPARGEPGPPHAANEALAAQRTERIQTAASVRIARRFQAADQLLDAGFPETALELGVLGALDAVAARAGLSAPTLDQAAVWLYTDALPTGAVQPEEAGALAQALALAAAPAVPLELCTRTVRALQRLLQGS